MLSSIWFLLVFRGLFYRLATFPWDRATAQPNRLADRVSLADAEQRPSREHHAVAAEATRTWGMRVNALVLIGQGIVCAQHHSNYRLAASTPDEDRTSIVSRNEILHRPLKDANVGRSSLVSDGGRFCPRFA